MKIRRRSWTLENNAFFKIPHAVTVNWVAARLQLVLVILTTVLGLTWARQHFWTAELERYFVGISRKLGEPELIIIFFLSLVNQYAKSLRISFLIEGKLRPPSFRFFWITTTHSALGFLLPGKIGEIVLPSLLKYFRIANFFRGAGLLVFVRVSDLVFVSAIFLLFGMAVVDSSHLRSVLAVGLLLFLASILLIQRGLSQDWVVLRSAAVRWPKVFAAIESAIKPNQFNWTVSKKVIYIGLTASIWISTIMAYHYIAVLGASSVTFAGTAFGMAATALTFVLPAITVANLGPMELAWAWAASEVGGQFASEASVGLVIHAGMLFGSISVAIFASLAWSVLNVRTHIRRNKT